MTERWSRDTSQFAPPFRGEASGRTRAIWWLIAAVGFVMIAKLGNLPGSLKGFDLWAQWHPVGALVRRYGNVLILLGFAGVALLSSARSRW